MIWEGTRSAGAESEHALCLEQCAPRLHGGLELSEPAFILLEQQVDIAQGRFWFNSFASFVCYCLLSCS